MIRAATLAAALLALVAIAAAGILHTADAAILPRRRREFEPGTDLNYLLDDAGRRMDRAIRKAGRAARLRELQRRAFVGEVA